MTNTCGYYSHSQRSAFECTEKWFRTVQSALLLFMIFCFIFYMITIGIDVAKLSTNYPILLLSLGLDGIAMGAIILGVRGVALEVWPFVIIFDVAIILVAIGHGVMVACCAGDGGRHGGLTATNFLFDALLAKLALFYTVLYCRFLRLKPADYDERLKKSGISGGKGSEVENLTEEVTGGRTSAAETGITGMELSDVAVSA